MRQNEYEGGGSGTVGTVNKESDIYGEQEKGRSQTAVPSHGNRTQVAKVSSTLVYLIKQTLSMYSARMQIPLGGKPTQFKASAFLQIQLSQLWAYNQYFQIQQNKPRHYTIKHYTEKQLGSLPKTLDNRNSR